MTFPCPLCGNQTTRLTPGWERVEFEAYQFGTMLVQPGVEYERKEPSGLRNSSEAVGASFRQSLITGLVCGIGSTAGAVLLGRHIITCIIVGVFAACLGFCGTWLWVLRDDRRLLWRTERVIGADLDGDNVIGEPERELKPPDVWLKQEPRHRKKYPTPFATWDEAHKVAVAVLLQGHSFTRRTLVRLGALPDDPEHYTEIFNGMLSSNLMVKNGNSGILTDEGREYLASFLPTPLQRRIVSGNSGIPTSQLQTNR